MRGTVSPKQITYLLLAAFLLLCAFFHLGPALLTGLLCHTFLSSLHRPLSRGLGRSAARYVSLAFFLIVLFLVGWMLVKFVKQSVAAVPDILARLIPELNRLSARFGFDFQFDTIDQLQAALMTAFRDNLGSITRSSQLLTQEFFKLFLGGFTAVFYFMEGTEAKKGKDLYDAVGMELDKQVRQFLASFERVLGAQVVISVINTTLTAVFLALMGFPYFFFLILTTFLCGLVPIIGNLISNTVILGTALTVSPHHALLALLFLLVIHKGEYFLNSKIVGSNVQMPMWQTLLAILVGEVTLGLSGIPLAPALWHYVRREMRETKV